MSKPPSAPPDAQLIALFRAEIGPAAGLIAGWLRSGECTTEQVPTQVMNAVLTIKSATRVLGIAELAEFVDAIERCVDACPSLPPTAHRDALQVMSHALTYLDQLERAAELPQFVTRTRPELVALVQALDTARASSEPSKPEAEDEAPDASLLELFRTEVDQCTKSLSDGVLLLDAHGPLLAPWESLMRAAHSLKGAARIVKLAEVAQLAHALEECFLVAQATAAPLPNGAIDALLQAIDALQNAGKVVADRVPGARAQAESAAAAIRPRLVELAERRFASSPPTSRGSQPPAAGETAAEPRNEAKPSATAAPRLTLVQPAIPAESVLEQFVNRDTIIAPFAGTQAPEASAQNTPGPAKPPAAPEPTPTLVPAKTAPPLDSKPSTPTPRTAPLAPRTSQGPKQERVLRVAADSINRLMGLAGESVVESRRGAAFGRTLAHMKKQHATLIDLIDALERAHEGAAAQQIVRQAKEHARAYAGALGDHVVQLDDYLRRASDLGERVYREALRSRMRPFADGTHGFPRLVRDLSQQLGKRARLEVEGENTEVDRDALDSLEAPINHLLRNALDHGVEPPAERTAANKSPVALLRIEARHHAGMLSIAISDDGRGIDVEAIRKKAIDRGLASAALAGGLTRAELIEFLFLPGFSTAAAVSEISGRGVGLDVVKNSVEALGGSVRVHSERGRGTTFHLHLPVTRSVVRAVVADVDGEAYAFPLLRIDRIDRVPVTQVKTLENREYVLIDEHPVALVSARSLFELEGGDGNEELQVIVISDRTRRYGVVVDALRGEHDLFVRPLDSRLGKVQDIAAAAILLDGAPALIVDVDDLMRSIERRIQSGGVRRSVGEPSKPAPAVRKRVLVVDDSIMVREAERQLLESRGYSVDVAVDGVDGWNSIRRARYDLVITDVDMPRMNGIELVRSIKRDAKLSATPVVIVSYKDRDEDRMRGLEAGANYYLSKGSFDDDKLVEAVQDLIGGAAA